MYRCRVERDSVSLMGVRLTSFVVEFPRVVLAEVVTHRLNSDVWTDDVSLCERTTTKDVSKNSASSRAIPHEKFVKKIQADPYVPRWTLAGRGMQGAFAGGEAPALTAEWLGARDDMLRRAEALNALGAHKQDGNRLLEPWAWVTQIVTASRWDNFFALRCHPAAHPAFQRVARMMYLARERSSPVKLDYGQWHLPFVPPDEQALFRWEPDGVPVRDVPPAVRASAARCAWISYENHEKDASREAIDRTWNRLIHRSPDDDDPVHASPVEHQATPLTFQARDLESNLGGWLQARKLVPREACREYRPSADDVASWGLGGVDFWPEAAP